MKKILLLDPSISNVNIGDEIIADGVKKGLKHITEGNFVVKVSTHLPMSLMYQRCIGTPDYKFVCGSNLIMGKLNKLFKQWHITYKDIPFLKGTILCGVGWNKYGNEPNLYTKILYRSILSKKYLHSVRDEYTKEMLNKVGIDNVINTACPTLWSLTPDFCKTIPTTKAKKVVFTLTDYGVDLEKDKQLIDILLNNYEEVYYWGQGVGDFEYIHQISNNKDIKIINPTLEEYDEFLKNNEVDYIGTRLHGGIRAMQFRRRSIILSIDNRAKEMGRDFHINVVDRNELDKLEETINGEVVTKLNLPWENIEKWKSQFKA